MSLAAGSKLGPYEILAPLGAGGMGEVWKAKDTRLDRLVAVKVLPERFSNDPDLLSRFEREAKAVAALNHPNILALFDIGRQGDVAFAVMELLEGESLRSRLEGGALPPRKAVELAIQMAKGLAAAHEKGVVHRDLKPDNLWVTKDGRLKILDFGLAKQVGRSDAPLDSGLATEALSAGAPATGKGTILGTVGYMSPEQVRGESVDARSDLFSFGAVLYEMVTGARAFARGTATDTLAAILRDDPPELPSSTAARAVPAGLERIVAHCLEKSADQRFRSAHDVAFALENLSLGSDRSAPFTAPFAPENRKTSRKWAGLVALLALAAAAAGWFLRGGPPPGPTFHRRTFQQGTVENARFGPDGKTVLFSARWKGEEPAIYSIPAGGVDSQRLDIESSTLLAVSKSSELAVLLTPQLTYGFYPGRLARVPSSGGGAREIQPSVIAADWDPVSGELASVSVANAEWTLQSPPGKTLRTGEGFDFPRFAPEGGRLAIFEGSVGLAWPILPAAGRILLIDPSGKETILANDRRCTGLAWSPAGDEIWFSEWIDGSRTVLSAVSLGGAVRTLWTGPGNIVLQDVAPDGRVLVQARQLRDGVLFLDEGASRERDVSIFDGTISVGFTPDRRALLVNERGGGGGPRGSVFLCPLDGGLPTKLSEGRAEALSPDGKRVIVGSTDHTDRYLLVPTGTGPTVEVPMPGLDSRQIARFLPDGERMVAQGKLNGGRVRIFLQDLRKPGTPIPVSPEGSLVWQGADPISPDGRSLVVHRDTEGGGIDEVISLEDGSSRQIPGREARDIPIRWTPDGTGLYVFKREGLPVRIFRLDIATGEKTPVREFMPADPGGITGMTGVTMTPDAKKLAFNYRRRISELFVVEGLR